MLPEERVDARARDGDVLAPWLFLHPPLPPFRFLSLRVGVRVRALVYLPAAPRSPFFFNPFAMALSTRRLSLLSLSLSLFARAFARILAINYAARALGLGERVWGRGEEINDPPSLLAAL